jgi:SAM-dependent methyltransferase
MKGRVLDVGGIKESRRGNFRPPLDQVDGWEYLNLDETTNPDYCCSADNIPLESNSIDTVLLCEVLEHVENPDKVISEIARILKPGG